MGIVVGIFFGVILWLLFFPALKALWIQASMRRREKEQRSKELQDLKEYQLDPELLRDHDLVASVWFDRIKGRENTPELAEDSALVVAAGTRIEALVGRAYDGRPIQQGWMRPEDYREYFAFLDRHGSYKDRHQAIFVRAGYQFMENIRPGFSRSFPLEQNSDLMSVSDLAMNWIPRRSTQGV